MGTNYYLRSSEERCPTCGRHPSIDEIHIGKSSWGWVFGWRGYRAEDSPFDVKPDERGWSEIGTPVTTSAQWFALLREKVAAGSVIVDEYGDVQDVEEFLRFVVAKRGPWGKDARPPSRRGRYRDSIEDPDGDDLTFGEFS